MQVDPISNSFHYQKQNNYQFTITEDRSGVSNYTQIIAKNLIADCVDGVDGKDVNKAINNVLARQEATITSTDPVMKFSPYDIDEKADHKQDDQTTELNEEDDLDELNQDQSAPLNKKK